MFARAVWTIQNFYRAICTFITAKDNTVAAMINKIIRRSLQLGQSSGSAFSVLWPQNVNEVEAAEIFVFSTCSNSCGIMNAFLSPSWISPNRSHLSDWISVPSFYILQLISTPWWETVHWWKKQLDKICINKCSSFNIICAAALLIIHNYPAQAGREE